MIDGKRLIVGSFAGLSSAMIPACARRRVAQADCFDEDPTRETFATALATAAKLDANQGDRS